MLAGDTVLYVTPTKALAADQLRSIRALGLPGVQAAVYDGDSTRAERDWARSHARYLLTTPDMLHRALLPGHHRWSGFFGRLRYVVVDECHGYRGVFGSHVAHVLRRLRRVVAHHAPVEAGGSRGRSSSSLRPPLGAPGACARLLTGLDAHEVTEDGSPRGPLAFALWEPPLTDARGEAGARLRRTATAQAADLLGRLVKENVQTLAFIRSRRGAEAVALAARRGLDGAQSGAGTGRGGSGGPRGRQGGGLPVRLPAGGPAAAGGGAVRRQPDRAGHHHRARARGQHHRPGRGADRRLARDVLGAVAAGRPGRAQRAAPRPRC